MSFMNINEVQSFDLSINLFCNVQPNGHWYYVFSSYGVVQ